MDAASLLIALIFAGQSGWTPERSTALPPTSSPSYDRYAQPPSSGTATTRQASNPFASTTSTAPSSTSVAPPTGSRSRSSVAPPPWTGTSATSAPDWDNSSDEFGPTFGTTAPAVQPPMRTNSGWTSIGSLVAAPPLGVPALTATPTTAPATVSLGNASTSNSRSTAPPLGRYDNPPPTSGADNWSTGWGTDASAGQATISRPGSNSSRTPPDDSNVIPLQTADRGQPAAQPPSNNSWADLWGDKDPWADSPQTPAGTATTQAPASTASQTPINPGNPPLLAAPSNNLNNTPAVAPVIVEPVNAQTAARSTAPPAPTGDEPPWLPLLVVSLSLAGSLGANLFLGWSYLDARQRYSSLVRKTAEKFHHAVSAAA